MRLNENHKRVICGNIEIVKFCSETGIDVKRLTQCNIEKMGGLYMFVLNKNVKSESQNLLPLDIDMETQPDVVLIVDSSSNPMKIETTDKTQRLLCI